MLGSFIKANGDPRRNIHGECRFKCSTAQMYNLTLGRFEVTGGLCIHRDKRVPQLRRSSGFLRTDGLLEPSVPSVLSFRVQRLGNQGSLDPYPFKPCFCPVPMPCRPSPAQKLGEVFSPARIHSACFRLCVASLVANGFNRRMKTYYHQETQAQQVSEHSIAANSRQACCGNGCRITEAWLH